MDLTNLFDLLEKESNKNPSTGSVTIPIGNNKASLTISTAKQPDVWAFPLYIGKSDNEVRITIDEALRKDNPFSSDNGRLIQGAVHDFTTNCNSDNIWIEMPVDKIGGINRAYRAKLAYIIYNPLTASTANRCNITIGFSFPFDPAPIDDQIGWFKRDGYFFAEGNLEATEKDGEIKLDEFVITGVNYFDVDVSALQEIVSSVPF